MVVTVSVYICAKITVRISPTVLLYCQSTQDSDNLHINYNKRQRERERERENFI